MRFLENRRRCKAFLVQRIAELEAMSTEDLLSEFGGDGGVHEEYPEDGPLGDLRTLHVRVEAIENEKKEPDGRTMVEIFVSCYTMDFNFFFPPGYYFFRYV